MAHISLQMTATGGIAAEHCFACGRPFERGETMNAVEYDNGEKAGWLCQKCIDFWEEHGRPPEPEEIQK